MSSPQEESNNQHAASKDEASSSSSSSVPSEKKGRKLRPQSYGVVIWTKKGDEWNWILQKSTSSIYKDLKLDPFRGVPVENETSAQTAARELEEETLFLFQIPAENFKDTFIQESIYHIAVEFEDGNIESVVADSKLNRENLAHTTLNGWKLIEGLSAFSVTELRSKAPATEPRTSSQVKRILRRNFNPESLPTFKVKRTTSSVDASKLNEGAPATTLVKYVLASVVSEGNHEKWIEPRPERPPREVSSDPAGANANPEAKKKRKRKNRNRKPKLNADGTPVAPATNADGSPATPAAPAAPALDADGKPIEKKRRIRKRGPRKPRLNADGTPFVPAPRADGSADNAAPALDADGNPIKRAPRVRGPRKPREPRLNADGTPFVPAPRGDGSADNAAPALDADGNPIKRPFRPRYRGPRKPRLNADGTPFVHAPRGDGSADGSSAPHQEGEGGQKRPFNRRRNNRGPRNPADGSAPAGGHHEGGSDNKPHHEGGEGRPHRRQPRKNDTDGPSANNGENKA